MTVLELPKISSTKLDVKKSLIVTLGMILFSNSLAQKVSEIVSISSFISEVEAAGFLYVLCFSSLISIAASFIQSKIIDRSDRLSLLKIFSAILSISFLTLRVLYAIDAPKWLVHGAFYLLSEQQFTFFPLIFWVLASDFIDPRNAKRIFPRLSAVGFVGNLAGIGIAALAPGLAKVFDIQSQDFLSINALIYAVLFCILLANTYRSKKSVVLREDKEKRPPERERSVAWGEGSHNWAASMPALYPLAAAILASISVEVIIEYRFFIVSADSFTSSESYQLFLSIFTLARTFAYIGIQRYITERVISNITLKNSFLILPIGSLFGILSMGLVPGLWGTVAGFSFQKLPQYSIDETARKTLLSSIPKSIRGRVSVLLDSYLIASGTVLGCFAIVACNLASGWIGLGDRSHSYILLGILLSFVGIYSIYKMRQQFEYSFPDKLSQRLKARAESRNKEATRSNSSAELTLMTTRSRHERRAQRRSISYSK
ncbi:MAG: hypothetical protein AAGB13_03260 [Cyanobacteria bacterium P01_F01_bin.33]